MKIIVISGGIASGKTTVARQLQALRRSRAVSCGDVMRREAAARSLPTSRQVLQRIGRELVESDPKDFSRRLLAELGRSDDVGIIEGVRHLSVLKAIKSLAREDDVYAVHILASFELREQRSQQRCDDSSRILTESTDRSEPGCESELITHADLILDGARPVSDLVAAVLEHIQDRDSDVPSTR